jgi:hypothetical protein
MGNSRKISETKDNTNRIFCRKLTEDSSFFLKKQHKRLKKQHTKANSNMIILNHGRGNSKWKESIRSSIPKVLSL